MYPINQSHPFILVLPILLTSQLALAETATKLDDVVVTANRIAKSANETLVPVTIITRADIERYQANDLTEVLRLCLDST